MTRTLFDAEVERQYGKVEYETDFKPPYPDGLADRLKYNAATLAALAKWADIGAKKPKRDFRKWPKKVDPRKRIKERVSSS